MQIIFIDSDHLLDQRRCSAWDVAMKRTKYISVFSGHFLGYFCLPWESKVEIITAISATLTSLRERNLHNNNVWKVIPTSCFTMQKRNLIDF